MLHCTSADMCNAIAWASAWEKACACACASQAASPPDPHSKYRTGLLRFSRDKHCLGMNCCFGCGPATRDVPARPAAHRLSKRAQIAQNMYGFLQLFCYACSMAIWQQDPQKPACLPTQCETLIRCGTDHSRSYAMYVLYIPTYLPSTLTVVALY